MACVKNKFKYSISCPGNNSSVHVDKLTRMILTFCLIELLGSSPVYEIDNRAVMFIGYYK
jgi:hypothetical protein